MADPAVDDEYLIKFGLDLARFGAILILNGKSMHKVSGVGMR